MKPHNLSVRIIILIFAIVLTASHTQAYAADKILSENITAKNNRIFSVPVGISSDKTLTAGKFTLKYDKSSVSFRGVTSLVNNATVKAVDDEQGITTVIFLQSDGVKPSKTKKLFTVEYKKISEESCNISISAEDLVDENAKNFTAPEPCDEKITVDRKTSEKSGRKNTTEHVKTKSNAKTKKKVVTASNSDVDKKLVSQNKTIDSIAGANYNPLVMGIVIIAALVISSLLAAGLIRGEKQKKENKDGD